MSTFIKISKIFTQGSSFIIRNSPYFSILFVLKMKTDKFCPREIYMIGFFNLVFLPSADTPFLGFFFGTRCNTSLL